MYWNIGNYKTNKLALINEVQNSFDSSVETYYANLAKSDFFAFLDTDTLNIRNRGGLVSIIQSDSIININVPQKDSEAAIGKMLERMDSAKIRIRPRRPPGRFSKMHFFRQKMRDSSGSFRRLFNRLITSASIQNLDLGKLDSLLHLDLKQKEIDLTYQLNHFEDDSLLNTLSRGKTREYVFTAVSKSNYLLDYQKLELKHNNPVLVVLKKESHRYCTVFTSFRMHYL